MELIIAEEEIKEYLKVSEIIDFDDISIKKIADDLRKGTDDEIELAKKVYEFVRDEIHHSFDINGEMVTCKASEVLMHKQGLCYAKAHLLAALLRYLGIPTGFCYQGILSGTSDNSPIVLHGLNSIYLKGIGKWIRLDARGNKPGVNAEFSVKEEKVAYIVKKDIGEFDNHIVYSKPNYNVINSLKKYKAFAELKGNLPSSLIDIRKIAKI